MSIRRRVPRRKMNARIGLLVQGQYRLCRAYQLGEGGMLIEAGTSFPIDTTVLVTFRIPNAAHVVVKAQIRYEQDAVKGIYGIEFIDLDFAFKREIRNFVASQMADQDPKVS